MEIPKYKSLKTRIREKSFETNFKGTDFGLFLLSFLGNAGAIFFAFFLINPALQSTISQHLSDSLFFSVLGVVISITILVAVEYIKRKAFKVFSAEFIESSYNLFKTNIFSLFMLSITIFAASFYFSITGGIKFSKLGEKKNQIVVQSNKVLYDSLTKVSEASKIPVNEEIANLRESNKTLRDKRDATPLGYRNARTEYTTLIESNEAVILKKQEELKAIDKSLTDKINKLKLGEKEELKSNEDSDFGSIVLFLIISSLSEFLIMLGVFFRELYEHRSFYENENKLEPILKKRERYEFLLRIVYRNGEVMADDPVISLSKLTQLTKNKGAQYPANAISDFYLECSSLGIFKVITNRRYAMVSYDQAKKLIETLQG
jgi:hypothetical protein